MGQAQGEEAVTRRRQRIFEIAAEGMPIQAVASAHRARALLVLVYVAQLAVAPGRIEKAERVEVCRLCCFPPNTLAKRSPLDFAQCGAPRFGSAAAACEAALARTALRTLPQSTVELVGE